jgi:hypothetical protein
MWKLLFLARRGWMLVPREHRREAWRIARRQVRTHGPTVARAAHRAVRQARAETRAARARLKAR